MGKTIKAMKRVAEIRRARDQRFAKLRQNESKKLQKKQIIADIQQVNFIFTLRISI